MKKALLIYIYPNLYTYNVYQSHGSVTERPASQPTCLVLQVFGAISYGGRRKSPAHAERAFDPTWGTQRKLSVRRYPGPSTIRMGKDPERPEEGPSPME